MTSYNPMDHIAVWYKINPSATLVGIALVMFFFVHKMWSVK